MKWFCSALVIVFLTAAAPGSAGALLDEVRDRAVVLESGSFSAPDLNVAPIAVAAENARIVGLGEASHGTSEVYELKDRLLRYLATHDGFTVLVMEGDWAYWSAIDRYIKTGDGSADDLLRRQDFAMYKTREMQTLIEWLRTYNQSMPDGRKISVVGMDFQRPVEPEQTFSIVTRFAQRYAPQAVASVEQARACFNKMTAPTAAAITTSCDAELDAVRNVFSRGQVDGKAQGENRSLALESLEILRHGQMMLRGRTHAARDRMMAANVAWIANTVFPNARIAVSAHDGHICTYDSHWMTLGSELRRIFGSAYYALGTTFGTGAVRAHPVAGGPFIPVQISKVPETSVATLFGNITEPFFLDIDAVPAASPLGQWLNQPQSLWMPGGVVLPQNVKPYALDRLTLARAFDGIVYLPVSHPTAAL